MRRPKPDPLSLTEVERNALERLVRRHSTSQQMALRGVHYLGGQCRQEQ